MKKTTCTWWSVVIVALNGMAFSARAGNPGDDADLTGVEKVPVEVLGSVPIQLPVDRVVTTPLTDEQTLLEVWIDKNGQKIAVPGLVFQVGGLSVESNDQGVASFREACGSSKNSSISVQALLSTQYFSVEKDGMTYRIADSIVCQAKNTWIFKWDSNGGQGVGIWQIAKVAQDKLEKAVGLEFWKGKRLSFVWPDRSDYYQFRTVHISKGYQWDVVGHEMGHGIYDLGRLGDMPGGFHKIDECYSAGLALSEGWASYFSAWISLNLADSDARFEYLVPRRAPIRIENIPEDVCAGQKNEWRVSGFFWDLIDLHADAESAQESFTRIWNAIHRRSVPSAEEAAIQLERAGLSRELLKRVWVQNFKTPYLDGLY